MSTIKEPFIAPNGIVANGLFTANSSQVSIGTIGAGNGLFINTSVIIIGNSTSNLTLTPTVSGGLSGNSIVGTSVTGTGISGTSNSGYGVYAQSNVGNPFGAGNATTTFVNIDNAGNLQYQVKTGIYWGNTAAIYTNWSANIGDLIFRSNDGTTQHYAYFSNAGAFSVSATNAVNPISGTSNSGYGLSGTSTSNSGASGVSLTGAGVSGQSNTSNGGSFTSNSGYGVYVVSSSGNLFGAANATALSFYLDNTGAIHSLAGATFASDLYTFHTGANTTGYLYFGSGGNGLTTYLDYDGSNYNFGGAHNLYVNGAIVLTTQTIGAQSVNYATTAGTATSATSALNANNASYVGGFTPVQQGGGTGQGTNKVYLGWLGTQLGLQIDTTNYGGSWPINVTGSSNTTNTSTYTSYVLGTNIGNTSATIAATPTNQNWWATLPIGYHNEIVAATANGTPDASYGFFHKISNRDASGGWGGLWLDYSGPNAYFGISTANTNYATWYQFATLSNGSISISLPSATNTAVYGQSGSGNGVSGVSNTGYGVYAQSNSGSIAAFANASGTQVSFDNNGNLLSNSYVQSLSIKTTSVATTSYAVTNADSGTVLLCSNTATQTITLPATMATSTRLLITRQGTGNVNISNAAGLTLGSRTSNYNVLLQYGSVSVYFVNNSLAIIDGNI